MKAEDIWMKLADLLPKRLLYWAIIKVASGAAGKTQAPSDVSAFQMSMYLSKRPDNDAHIWSLNKIRNLLMGRSDLTMVKFEAPPPFDINRIKPFMAEREKRRAATVILNVLEAYGPVQGRNTAMV